MNEIQAIIVTFCVVFLTISYLVDKFIPPKGK